MSIERFVRIPPDSTGKRVRNFERESLEITTETQVPLVGQVLSGETSTARGAFLGAFRTDTQIFYSLEKLTATGFSATENIKIGPTTIATSVGVSETLYGQATHISDADVPEQALKIDKNGAAFTRFTEGTQQLDAYGRSQVSQLSHVAQYEFILEDTPDLFLDEITGASSIVHLPQESSVRLQIPTTSGAIARRTSHLYHPYSPGVSQLIYMTLVNGDAGKTDVVRRWGYFDGSDGVFFQLSGTTFQVVLRSSTTGSVIDTVVSQSNFNDDNLETVSDEFIYSTDTVNIYWIDMEWLGAGKVRMGLISPDGERVIIHSFKNVNINSAAYMRTASLPIRWEIENIGTSVSTSEMKFICASVFSESVGVTNNGRKYYLHPDEPTIVSGTGFTTLMTIRPQLTLNSLKNTFSTILEHLEVDVSGDSVLAHIVEDATLTGDVYNDSAFPNGSSLEFDFSGQTSANTGNIQHVILCAANDITSEALSDQHDQQTNLINAIRLNADGVTQPTLSVDFKVIKSGGSANVFPVLKWKEIK